MRFTTALAMMFVLGPTLTFAQTRAEGFEVRTLSTRPDMVSGGDVLIQITVPPSAGTDVAISVNGHEPSVELARSRPISR